MSWKVEEKVGWRGRAYWFTAFAGGIDARGYAGDVFGELLGALWVDVHVFGHCWYRIEGVRVGDWTCMRKDVSSVLRHYLRLYSGARGGLLVEGSPPNFMNDES